MNRKLVSVILFLLVSCKLFSQTIEFPLKLEKRALKDSLIAVFNYPVKPNTEEGFTDQLYARFPWLKAIDNHPRYHLSTMFEAEDLLAGYGHLKSIRITSINKINGSPFGDYAPIDLSFDALSTRDVYTIPEFKEKSGFREITAPYLTYYTQRYFLPEGYDKVGVIFQIIKEDPKEYRSIKRPDGRKFDKDEGEVIGGYIIKSITKKDFEEDNNLRFSEKDWEHLEEIKRNHFANYFYNKHIDYFTKYEIDRTDLVPIIANTYLLEGEKYPDLDAAVADYRLRQKVPEFYEAVQKEYKPLGPYGADEANNAFISSIIYPCLEGNCNFGQGTVDMGKTTFTGTFENTFATTGVITEKSSGIKIKVKFNANSKFLSSGEYISDPNLTATFKRKNDSIYFDVDTKTFSYVGTTKGLSGRSGIITGKHTLKKNGILEIYTYKNGVADNRTATIRESTVGEFEYTGAVRQVGDDLQPFGEGRIGFPYYTKETAPVNVTGNLGDAISASPEAMKLLVSVFEENSEFNTPFLNNWYQEYLNIKDAKRYEIIQKLSDEDLIKYVHMENERKFKYRNIAHDKLSELINRYWHGDKSSSTNIFLISLKDGPSSFCLRTQYETGGYSKNTIDKQCVSFEKRGDIQEVKLITVSDRYEYSIQLDCEGCNADDYYVITNY